MGHRKTRIELMAACNEIRRLRIEEGYSNGQIIRAMKIPDSVFYFYQQKIWEQDKHTLERTGEEQLAHEIMILKERFEHSYRNLSEIAKNPNMKGMERIEAEGKRMEAAINIIKLLKEGPGAIGYHRTTESTAIKPELAREAAK